MMPLNKKKNTIFQINVTRNNKDSNKLTSRNLFIIIQLTV